MKNEDSSQVVQQRAVSALVTVLFAMSFCPVWGSEEPPSSASLSDVIDSSRILPHRLELRETESPGHSPETNAWVYVTVDRAQDWGKPTLMVNWTALTWNGTGLDVNWSDAETLAVLKRLTPFGAPAGVLVESHFYPDQRSLVAANPDGEVKVYADKAMAPSQVYNVILWPYVLASMDLRDDAVFVLPGYSPYGDRSFFYRLSVEGKKEVQLDDGRTFEAWSVRGVRAPTEDEARAITAGRSGRETVYWVSTEYPWFLGKEVRTISETGEIEVTTRWSLTRAQGLDISPADRVEEILEERGRRLAKGPQILPWDL